MNTTVVYSATFQALTAVLLKIRFFWDVKPCRLVNVYRHFEPQYCLHLQGPVSLLLDAENKPGKTISFDKA